jgi:transmembrane sensor
MIGFGSSDEVEACAATWAVRSGEGRLSATEQHELDAWLAESPRHLGAYLEAQGFWTDLDRIASLDNGASMSKLGAVRATGPRRAWRLAALAASIVVVLVASLLAYDRLPGRITANRGEVRTIALEDGSTLILNSTSVVQVHYSQAERRIILRGGEASFQVVHNTERPFVVEAGDLTVTAVGTEFTVDLDHHEDGVNKGAAVTVINGVVKVADIHAPNVEPPRLLKRDERLVATATGTWRTTLSEKEVDRQFAWRSGLLVFQGQQLGAAAAEVSRYAPRPVFVDDPTLARAEFVGTFRIGNAEAFARTAAAAFNAKLVERADGFHLDRQENSPSH